MKMTGQRNLLRTLLFGSFALMSACASITTRDEAGGAAKSSLPETPRAWAMAQEKIGNVEVGWIASFNDPTLSALVAEAQENNKNLQAAAANVDRARALARQAGAALKPSVTGFAGGSEGGGVDGRAGDSSFEAGLQIDWEIDVWGRIRSGQQAAAASAESAEADYLFTQYSIAAAVAQAYFVSIEAAIQEEIARETMKLLEETTRIVSVQYDNGLANSQDLALTKSDLASSRDTVSNTSGARRDALRAVEVLLGRYPSADLKLADALPETPPAPPAGVPSDILERRPDLIAAERNVAASFNSLDQAKAARLPRFALTSTVGGASTDLSEIFDPKNVAWNVIGNLSAPLFDGGQRQAQVEISTAEQKQAVAAYGQAALDAFSEVESGLDQGVVLNDRVIALQEAVEQAERAYSVARLRYDEGETDLIDVLTIQQRLFTTQSNLASVRRLLLDQRVTLNLALGGDWE
ncbi:MAG: efflux transporter outer membrane subunit [Pseudomonadota bacterium]